ncbi:MAG: hypothetical protein ACI9E5_000399 [Candidatus Omnitrophota bacterium]|jgi:hypothetical protein
MKKLIGLVIILGIFVTTCSYADNGVYSTSNTTEVKQKMDTQVNSFIEQMVIAKLINITSDMVERFARQNSLEILPQILLNNIQQIAVQVFQQEKLSHYPKDAYKMAKEKVTELRDRGGVSNATMQSETQRVIDTEIYPLGDDRMYHELIKMGLKNGIQQTRQYMMMAAAQRQAQIAVVQAQHSAMQQMMQRQYQSAVGQMMRQQQQAVAQQNMEQAQQVQRQYDQSQYEYNQQQQRMQQQYQQELQKRAYLEQQQLRGR